MHVIQLSGKAWLVLDAQVTPRYLITRGPMVHRETGETHIVHKVEWWNHVPASRELLAVCDGEMAAREWCRVAIENAVRAAERQTASLRPPGEMFRR